jgi:hypothetical protein
MSYRIAKSLDKLRSQIDTAHPNRSKASDGWIGDEAHRQDTTSDHNPDANGVVRALDITHDPANGVDINKLSDALVASRDLRIYYIIANGLICVPQKQSWTTDCGWKWLPYAGSNPHTSHMHISVYGDYDNTTDWKINEEDDMKITEDIARELYPMFLHRKPENENAWRYWIGRDMSEWISAMKKTGSEWHAQNGIIQSLYPVVKDENKNLKAALDSKPDVESVEALKAKIREIVK